MTVPNPVSFFDFHEGTGTTTTDIIGGLVLTSSSPGWVGGGGTTGQWNGAVGPAGMNPMWTAVFDTTRIGDPASIQNFGFAASSNPWFNWSDTGHAPAGRPGPYPPDQFGSVAMPLNTRCLVAYVFTGIDSKTYIDGALSGTFANTHPADFSGSWRINGHPTWFRIYSARVWDAALTAAQVAELSGPPTTSADAALAGAGVLAATAQQPPRIPAAASLGSNGALIASAVAIVIPVGGETVTVTAGGADQYDSDGNPVDGGAQVTLATLGIAPGNTLLTYGIGGDLDDVAFTVYLELGSPIIDDDEILVRGKPCRARVQEWRSPWTNRGGIAVLARSTTGMGANQSGRPYAR